MRKRTETDINIEKIDIEGERKISIGIERRMVTEKVTDRE